MYSEAPIIFEDGVKKSTQLTVHFRYPVFDLPKGTKRAAITDIPSQYSKLITYFKELRNQYGSISFIKQILRAEWGDIWRTNQAGQLVRLHDMSQLFTISFTGFVPIDLIIDEMQAMDEVQYAHQPIQTISFLTPNDPSYGSQWYLPKINATTAWDITKGSGTIKIGIIGKEGVKRDHPDLSSKIVDGGDYGYSGNHETLVAGIAGAATNNSIGIASLGWELKLLPYIYTPGPTGGTLPAKIDSARENGCKVINCSFSTALKIEDPECQTGTKKCYIVYSQNYSSVELAIANAINQSVVVVAAAGNNTLQDGNQDFENCDPDCDIFPYIAYPAAYNDVIAVSAIDNNDDFAGGLDWNYGSFIDVAAPGMNVLTTNTDNGYVSASGTSLAAPLVAALAGLIKSINPQLTSEDVEDIVSNTAIDLGDSGKDDYYGYGRINAYEALRYTLENYGGTLSGDVLLHGDLTIKSGATLVIESGTTITFAANQDDQNSGLDNTLSELTIEGEIEADGVIFTSTSSSANSWYGIILDGPTYNSYIKNSTIEWAKRGIIVDDCSPTHGIITYYNFILCASMSS